MDSHRWNLALLLFAKSWLIKILISQETWKTDAALLSGLKLFRQQMFGLVLWWRPVWRCSSLPWLHVGWYSSPSSQALKALVGVVDKNPVLVLQVGLGVVGDRSYWKGKRRRRVVRQRRFQVGGTKFDTRQKPVGVRMSESGNSSKFEVSSMLLISMGIAAGLSLHNRSNKIHKHVEPLTTKQPLDLFYT